MEGNVLCICWNTAGTAFGIGYESGFAIYGVTDSNVARRYSRRLPGGVGHISVLDRTNISAIVGGGVSSIDDATEQSILCPNTSVMIWDDSAARIVMELRFPTAVLTVKLWRTRLVVVLERQTYIYSHKDFAMKLIAKIETAPNPSGLVACAGEHIDPIVLGREPGTFVASTKVVRAHRTALAQLVVCSTAAGCPDGTIATASVTGTILRLFSSGGSLLREFRRGTTPGTITQLAFGTDMLIAISGSGTGHVYNLADENTHSSLRPLGNYIGYFAGEWSALQFETDPRSCLHCNAGLIHITQGQVHTVYQLLRGAIVSVSTAL